MAKFVCPKCGKELEAEPDSYGDIKIIPCEKCYKERTDYDKTINERLGM